MSDHRPEGKNQGANVLSAFQLHHLSLKRFIGRYLNNAHKAQLKRLTQFWHRANLLTELSIPLPDSKRPNGLFASLRYQF